MDAIIEAEHVETGRMVQLVAVGEWADNGDEACCVCGDWILAGFAAVGDGPSWCANCVCDVFLAPEE